MRTGILGGTFDPIHIAHLHAGECALRQAQLDRVLFMPAGEPWQKQDRALTPALHRVAMARLAAAGVEGFEVDTREVDRGGPTYTFDTLETFPGDEDLYLILGADAAAGLPTWHRVDEVLERVTVLVVPRPGVDSEAVMNVVPEARVLDMTVLGVSGTLIRRLASSGDPFRFLVPESVHDYIVEHRLYADPSEGDKVGDHSEMEESS